MRRAAPDLGFAVAVAAVVALATGVAYGARAAEVMLEILVVLGIITVSVARALDHRRERIGGLRRQASIVAVVAAVQIASAVLLVVQAMFVSSHDAFFTVLIALYATALALWTGRRLGLRALADLDAIRATLEAVGAGRRDVPTGVRGDDELARLAADVDAMVALLAGEERARRMLIAAVSHDLRTPITALRLLADAIDDEIADPATRRVYAARMSTHVRALSVLIDDLFELTRLESGELHLTMEQVPLEALVREAVEAMRPSASAGAVRVRAEVPAPAPAACANAEQLQRVLFNLIQNAIRHTPPDGSVTVAAQAVDGGVEVEVADTGSGIPDADRAQVFEPFFRGDEARRATGSGLGLAIARAIVEAHGGRIWLADAAVGTRVRFRLPAGAG